MNLQFVLNPFTGRMTPVNVVALGDAGTGFPNRTDTTIAFSQITRSFTIAPVASQYYTLTNGVRRYYSAPLAITIPNTTGPAFIYFDKTTGILSQMATFDISLIMEHVWIAFLYWNAAQQLAVVFGDERHSNSMSRDALRDLHQSFGTTWVSGLSLNNILPDASGSLDSSAQCGVTDGQINDEDLAHSIVSGSPETLTPTVTAPILWEAPAGVWNVAPVQAYPVLYSGRPGTGYTGASNQLAFNSAGSLQEAQNGHYVLAHLLATNDVRWPVVAICGRSDYATVANARVAAYTELLSLTGLPFTEFKPLGTLIFETSGTFANAVHGRIRSNDQGGSYIDLRRGLLLGANGMPADDVAHEVFLNAEPVIHYPAVNWQADGGGFFVPRISIAGTWTDVYAQRPSFALPCTEDITSGAFVNVWDNSGIPSIRNASAAGYGMHADGFVLAGGLNGSMLQVYRFGDNSVLAGLSDAKEYFLSDTTPGAATLIPASLTDHILQSLGFARGATVLEFKFSRPIIRR